MLRQSLHRYDDQPFVVSKEFLDSLANSFLLKTFNLVVYTYYKGEYTCVYSTHWENQIDIEFYDYERKTVEILFCSLELPPFH